MFENPNDIFTQRHAFDTRYSSNTLFLGKVTNKQRHHDLTQAYDVFLFDWGTTLRECKRANTYASYNGNGEYKPLEDGDPVIVLCKNGITEDAIIIGCFYTSGDYESFLDKGEGLKPGELVNNQEANQPSIHPNRVTQPDAHFKFTGAKNLFSPFDSPEFHLTTQDRATSRLQSGSIEMRNGTEYVNYTFGSTIHYSDGNNIIVSAGTNEDKCTNLMRLSSMHSKIAELITKFSSPSTKEESTGIKSIIPAMDGSITVSDFNEPLPARYRAEQNLELSKLIMQEAQNCNTNSAAGMQAVSDLQANHGNETGTPKPPTEQKDNVGIKPNSIKSTPVASSNKGERQVNQSIATQIYNSRYKKAFGEDPKSTPNYKDWQDLFTKEGSTSSKKVVVIGDSITQNLPDRGWLNQGISGDKSAGVLSRVGVVTGINPSSAVITIGTNDLLAGTNPTQIFNNIQTTVSRIRTQSPNTNVIVQSIPPMGTKVNPTIISTLNSRLKAAATSSGFRFIDSNSKLRAASGYINPKYTTDGVHLNSEGYKVMLSVLEEVL